MALVAAVKLAEHDLVDEQAPAAYVSWPVPHPHTTVYSRSLWLEWDVSQLYITVTQYADPHLSPALILTQTFHISTSGSLHA